MFSRRHPLLFFCLAFTAIVALTIIIVSLLIGFVVRAVDVGEMAATEGESVGIVEVIGAIVESNDIISQLKKFRENDDVKAIVLRVDSPGGGVGPSQEIYREVRKTSESKKVIVSMGAVAASGGYYVAASADGIVANPGTITGSIGVIMGFTNVQALMEKIGLVPVVIKSGDMKDVGSPVREMTEAEETFLAELAGELHQQFIDDIAEGRKMDPATVGAYADGRIFSGQKAKEIGLVDRLGNLEDAIEWAGRMGGIEGKIHTVYGREKKFSWLERLTEISLKSVLNRLIGQRLSADYLCPYQPVGVQ
jgi:protease IV